MTETDAALICRALGDPNRLRIVKLLTGGEKCACALLESLDITQPTLSHHMSVLSNCGLVNTRKEGKWSHYGLNCERLTDFRQFIAGLSCGKAKTEGCCK